MVVGAEGVVKPVRGPGRPLAYLTSDGKRVPSVTTILDRFKDPAPLMHWAWQEGCQGRDYRESRKQTADAGTVTHQMIDAEVHGEDALTCMSYLTASGDVKDAALTLYERFLDWSMDVGLQVNHTEEPLVSDLFSYGGTLDAVGRVNGELCLLDWKSGTDAYVDHLVQLSAYRELWNRNGHPMIDKASVLLLGDAEQGARHVEFDAQHLGAGFVQFEMLKVAYKADAELRKMVGK